MNVFTYYVPIPDMRDEDDERKLIALWERSWRKHGWEPVVLSEADIRHLPRFSEYKAAFNKLPTEYGHAYESACFMRWWATGMVGGQMMTDYDVINYGFLPHGPDGKMTLITDPPPHGSSMGVVCGEPWQFLEMADLMAQWVPCDHDINRNTTSGWRGRHHCSDASMIVRMFDDNTRERPHWFGKATGSRIYGEPGWDTSPLVHYGFRMFHDGHWPKHAHIEKLRPI